MKAFQRYLQFLNFFLNLNGTNPDALVSLPQDGISSKYFSAFPNSHMLNIFLLIIFNGILPIKTFWSFFVPVCQSSPVFLASTVSDLKKKKSNLLNS